MNHCPVTLHKYLAHWLNGVPCIFDPGDYFPDFFLLWVGTKVYFLHDSEKALHTIYVGSIDFSINHPVRLKHDISSQPPWWRLLWSKDGLARHPEAQQHDGHHDDDVEHVSCLQKSRAPPGFYHRLEI